MRANRAFIGQGFSFKNGVTEVVYFVNLKRTTPFLTHREILSNQDSISRFFFAELSLNVSSPTLGVESCGAIESKPKRTGQLVSLGH